MIRHELMKDLPPICAQEMIQESIQDAFTKLPQIKQDRILWACRNLNNNRTHPLSDKAKIEIVGKIGILLYTETLEKGV